MTARLRQLRSDESGSIVVALLVVIISASLVAVTLANIVGNQSAVRHDRNFTTVLHAADAGVEQAAFRLGAVRNVGARMPASGTPCAFSAGACFTGTLADSTFEWYAQRLGTTREWQVYSTAVRHSVRRRVVATIQEDRLFFAAAFANQGVRFNGNNRADSYSSGFGGNPAYRPRAGRLGLVGSNGTLTFLGNSTVVDGAQLFGYTGAAPPSPYFAGRCSGNANIGLTVATLSTPGYDPPALSICDPAARSRPINDTPYLGIVAEPRAMSPEPAVLAARAAACPSTDSYTVPPAGGTIAPATINSATTRGPVGAAGAPGSQPGYHCFNNVRIRGDLNVSGTAANPVVMYVTGNFTIEGNGTRVNCSGCNSTADSSPVAGALQIYMVGAGTFTGSSAAKFSGAFYGPQATCGGGAQAEIYGSIICNAIDNVGGWSFHYDEALDYLGNSIFATSRWQET